MDHAKHIINDAVGRLTYLILSMRPTPLLLASLYPRSVIAANTVPFEPVQTLSSEQASSVDQAGGSLDFDNWVNRGMAIRKGDSVYQCLANLTAALDLVGQLSASEYNGAAGALSLLPTAGALLGAPTREMWIVYKLVPMAGLLSMFLSLGGSITPSNVGEYDPAEPFSYGGFMPTTRVTAPRKRVGNSHTSAADFGRSADDTEENERTAAQVFAQEVLERAENDSGGGIRFGIFVAMALQFVLVIGILIPMWYAQRGAVVTWWCRVYGWMFFWYFLVTAVSIFDNLVAAPFTRSWTIRVSRKPTGILLDETIAKITDRGGRYGNALEAIKAGPNTNQRIRIATDRGSGYSRTCFYVVISVHGISRLHAIAQIVPKASSVAVFAFGTALFASATLMSISIALMVLCLLLMCGVGGRVIAMWIVSQIGRESKPILHKLVKSEAEAGEYIHVIAELDLQLEISGHVIMNEWCIQLRNVLFSPATYIGLLAKPFDAIALAEKSTLGPASHAQSAFSPMGSSGVVYNPLTTPSARNAEAVSSSSCPESEMVETVPNVPGPVVR